MSKKKKNKIPVYKLGDGSVPAIITEHLSKKGRLKASDKKQERILRGACVHHMINKAGKLKPTVSNNGKRECFCRICRSSFSTVPYDDGTVSNVVSEMKGLNNQAKFMITAIGGGNESQRFFSELGSMLEMYPSRYVKVLKVAKKADGIRRKKKKKKSSGASSYGSWK